MGSGPQPFAEANAESLGGKLAGKPDVLDNTSRSSLACGTQLKLGQIRTPSPDGA